MSDDISPCQLTCEIENTGNAAAKNVTVGFDAILPVDTQIIAAADEELTLKRSDTFPPPNPDAFYDMGVRAFTIKTPKIPPKTKLSFTLLTTRGTNIAACNQVKKIHEVRREIATEFCNEMSESGSVTPAQLAALDLAFSAMAKRECLYHPDKVSSDDDRETVIFITPSETRSLAMLNMAIKKAVSTYDEVRKRKNECMAAVFSVEQADGTSTQ